MITKIEPHPCLDYLIDYYWVDKNDSGSFIILPDGSSSIIFSIGSPFNVLIDETTEKTINHDVLIGVQKKYFVLSKGVDTYLIGVKFKQGEAFHFFKKPMLQFSNKIINLNDVFSVDTNSLEEVLVKAKNDDEIRKILNYFFFVNVESLICESKVVHSVIQKVKVSGTALLIKDLCVSENISNKHLISLFNKKVGISPKLLYRINKFLKVIEILQVSNRVNWSQIAQDCHYYDQAHLINEFKKFSSLSPNEYFENKNAIGLRIKIES